jgi:tetratricopeptide (TPR) repeat protein
VSTPAGTADKTPNASEVRQQLAKIIDSKPFARSRRMQRFLTYVVEHSLAKTKPSALKEYCIALAVYDKPASFDARLDSVVRVEAGRLRAKLREYYATAGETDRVVIALRSQGYAPVFRLRKRQPVSVAAGPEAEPMTGTQNAEAYRWHLQGRHYWNKRNGQGLAEAMRCFERAIAQDSQYGLPYAGLADCHLSRAWLELGPPHADWAAAEKAAARALKREPSLAQALCSMACLKAVRDRDWQESENLFRRAIDANPHYATSHHWYAVFCLAPQNRLREAMTAITAALRQQPISAPINAHAGWILYFMRDYEQAAAQCRRALEVDPTFASGYFYLGMISAQLSRFQDALKFFDRAARLSPQLPSVLSARGFVLGKAGRAKSAMKTLDALAGLSKERYVSDFEYAVVYSGLGKSKEAVRHLQKAAKRGSARLAHLKVDPLFDPLTFDDGYLTLLNTLHLV